MLAPKLRSKDFTEYADGVRDHTTPAMELNCTTEIQEAGAEGMETRHSWLLCNRSKDNWFLHHTTALFDVTWAV